MKRHYTLSGLLLCLMTLLTLGASAQDYLCFTANTASATVKLIKSGSPTPVDIEYSTDGTNWNAYTIGSSSTSTLITLANVGDKVYFRNAKPAKEVTGFSTSTSGYYYFVLAQSVAASGNVMSLVDKECKTTTIPCDYCFYNLFNRCTVLTSAPELPATTLTANCYKSMFNGCKALTTAPELPATTLASNCYEQMFYSCSSLTTAPELPATTLLTNCYHYMFRNCSSLNDVKCVYAPAPTDWLDAVPSTGTFTTYSADEPSGWTLKHTYDVTGTAIGWTSLCVNLPLEVPEGAKVYYAKSAEGSTITLEAIEAGTVMAAKTAVVVKADASTTVQFPIAGEDGTSYDNLFQGSSVAKAKTEDVYVLAGKSTPEKPIFQPYTGTTLGAHKIWLPKSAVGGASSIQFRFADATAVSTVETEAAEDVIYNLAGQRVGSDYRGLVIRNGKKTYNN